MAKRVRGVKHIKGDVYRIDYQVGKVRKQERIAAESLKEARTKRDELIVELRKQLTMPQSETARLNASLDEAWGKLKENLTSRPRKTFLRYKQTFQRIFGKFRAERFSYIQSVSQATLPFFAEYTDYYVNELKYDANGGLRAEIIILRAMMKRFYRLGYCGKEVIEKLQEIKKPSQKKKEYPHITTSQIKEMFIAIKKNRPDYYRPLYFICRTGRRIEEATKIGKRKDRDIVWNGLNPVRINVKGEITKTGDDAPIERLDENLQKVIKEAYQDAIKHKADYLFLNRRGRKCTSGRVRDYLKKVSKEILRIEVTPHYFRHRFLTECGKANVPLIDTMAISGIKDIGVLTKFYTHSTDEGQDKVLAVTEI